MINRFTEKDKKLAERLGVLLGKAVFNINIQESVDLTSCLMMLRDLPKKIDDHILEIRGIYPIAESPQPPAEIKPKSKKPR